MDLDIIKQLPSECAKAYRLALDVRLSIPKKLGKVVTVAGSLGVWVEKILCDLVSEGAQLPFIPIKGGSIPSYVAEDTLVIIFDAPDWHDEAQEVLAYCTKVKASVLFLSHESLPIREPVIGSNVTIFRLPENLKALLDSRYFFIPALAILNSIKELNVARVEFDEPEAVMNQLAWLAAPDIPSDANQPKMMADYLFGKVMFIYGVPSLTAGVAMRWKEQIRTAIGQLVAAYELPDIIVNEPSLHTPGLALERQMVFLRDRDENYNVGNKFQELVKANKEVIPQPIEIYGEGNSKLSRICYLTYLGDFVTAYLELMKK